MDGRLSEITDAPRQMLTHFDSQGRARMVDVTGKEETDREASAEGTINVSPDVLAAVKNGTAKKGDVLSTARLSGIMAAKRTSELIPLCHLLPLTSCGIEFTCSGDKDGEQPSIRAVCTVRNHGRTGVEMEALTGVSVALLTIYDMCKAIDKRMVIGDIHLIRKSGGKSGDFRFDPSEG